MSSCAVLKTIDAIAQLPGKNDKIAAIAAQADNELFKRVITNTLSPFVTFGILPNRSDTFGTKAFNDDTWAMLDDLSARRLTGNLSVERVQRELRELTPESSELLWRILNKDPRAGFSESSVNKAIKGLIPEFSYMRCSLPADTNLAEWDWESGVYSQLKADGVFVNTNIEDAKVSQTTRPGHAIPSPAFADIYAGLSHFPNVQIHGELVVIKNGLPLERKVGNGLINKVINGGVFPAGCTPMLQVWDMIPLAEVKPKGRYETPYRERINALSELLALAPSSSVRLVETRIVHSIKEAYAHYFEKLKEGLEGTVLKKATAIWFDGTSTEQIKLKLDALCELEVLDFMPGTGKNADTFGSLVCATSCRTLVVKVSGFKAEKRLEIHNNRDTWTGMVISVMFNAIMFSDKPKKPHSLFLPRFQYERLDKFIADDFDQVVKQFENAIEQVELGIAA